MGIRIFSRRGYELSINEQRAAVLLAQGSSVVSISDKLGITELESVQVCRSARVKLEKSFPGQPLDHLRLIDFGSIFCMLLCVIMLFQDGDANRIRKMKERVRRREDSSWVI